MENRKRDRNDVFRRAWDIIVQDKSIAPEEKEGILKLIQVLVEATEASPAKPEKDEQVKGYTQEIISKHSLMTLVKQQADELDALKRIGLNLTSSLDLQTVLETVVTEAMKLIKNSRAAHIFLYSHEKLDFGASLNSEGISNKPVSMPRSNGLTYLVANNGLPIIVEDIKAHPLYKNAPQEWNGSIIGVPLKFSNSIVGVMNVSRSTTGGFTRAEMRLIGLLADQAAVAISNASLHKGVTEMANTDSVTGLPNRRALDERLQEEMRYARNMNSKFSVVMMDLDGFKNVNDTLGHSIGDDVLRHVFNYLAEKMRATDFLARYGGDELTLIMRDSDVEVAQIVANKIVDLMKSYTFPIPGSKPVQLGITAGIAVYPLHSHNASDLLRAADAALYWAKKHNRGKFVFAKVSTGPLDPLVVRGTKKE
ncbi:MAG: sensor domain-containing diguanylate cyclase [Anaerolineales bacterium]